MSKLQPPKTNRYPYRKLDGTLSETVNVKNLMCPDQIASNPKYRDNYDEIQWESDSHIADMERMERQKDMEKEN